MDIQEIVKQDSVHIIDVRETYEFESEHVENAVNMPLSHFADFVDTIKEMKGDKVFYCRSGNRSGQAVNYLQSLGIKDTYNGGSYMIMNSFLVA
ncbi:rhodanese-like domain-containing protein [Portibacter lacus]|uniref:Rhodanese domain-containing protein n=1 Tax=Portibacter lacus TaxID=1099794 RepID=A0AA37SMU5_9BACT|nr:rhodanese-like domain-containing protein [Portibacter lacus]GLR17678.1 hypothetical protein GCM10007940_22930 [Portibacter lacus]